MNMSCPTLTVAGEYQRKLNDSIAVRLLNPSKESVVYISWVAVAIHGTAHTRVNPLWWLRSNLSQAFNRRHTVELQCHTHQYRCPQFASMDIDHDTVQLVLHVVPVGLTFQCWGQLIVFSLWSESWVAMRIISSDTLFWSKVSAETSNSCGLATD